MNREAGGALLAALGFVALVAAFKGTWRNTFDALLGRVPSSSTSSAPAPLTDVGGGDFPGTSTVPGSTLNPRQGGGNPPGRGRP